MKRTVMILALCAALSGCGRYSASVTAGNESDGGSEPLTEKSGVFESEETFANECSIMLGDMITVQGGGAVVEDNRISITEGGVYIISGVLDDGMICVDSEAPVKLILDGAEIRSGGSAISNTGGKLIIECAENTENFLYGGDEAGAVLYGENKLVICGGGAVEIDAGKGAGIEAKGKLKLSCRNITVKGEGEPFTAESVEIDEGAEIRTDK